MLSNIALLLVALTLQGGQRPATDALADAYLLFIQGRVLGEEDNLPGAAAKFRQALEVMPDSAEIRAELAGVYAQQGDLARAREEADRALRLEATNRSAHRLLGLIEASAVQRAAGDASGSLVNSAIAHLEASAVEGLRDPAAMLTLGRLYVQAGRHPQAIQILELFLLDQPGYAQAILLLAEAYRASGQPDRATALLEELRAGAAESPQSRSRGLELLEARGQWAEAAAGWAGLLEENPRDVPTRLRYAAALVNSGDVPRGLEQLRAITRDEPTEVAAWHLLAQVEQRAGQPEAAEQAARRIVEIDPTDARGPLALADVRAGRHDHQGVVDVLAPRVGSSLEADAENGMLAEMAIRLADAYSELGDPKRAIRALQGASARAPGDNQILFSLAATYEQDRQFGRAESTFREVIASDPEHAPALNYLGYMLADRGQKLTEAVTLIERAVALDADNPAYLDSLGWALFRLARFAEAISPLERAAAGAPKSSVIQDHLGDAYLKLERYADAAAAFDRALAGDRDGIDAGALTRKRDRARAASGKR